MRLRYVAAFQAFYQALCSSQLSPLAQYATAIVETMVSLPIYVMGNGLIWKKQKINFLLFNFRSKEVCVEFICVDEPGKLTQNDLQVLNDAAKGIQLAQRITGNISEFPVQSTFLTRED